MSYLLIVDDDWASRELMQAVVRPFGHPIRQAASALEALSCIEQCRPLVVLCDVHLPAANGLWLADQIRSVAPATGIVLVTGDSGIPPVESLREGIVAYVLKPFRREVLFEAVERGIRASAAHAAGPPPRRRQRLLSGSWYAS